MIHILGDLIYEFIYIVNCGVQVEFSNLKNHLFKTRGSTNANLYPRVVYTWDSTPNNYSAPLTVLPAGYQKYIQLKLVYY